MDTAENKIISSRIIIEGDKVHKVGYRPFLLAKALRLGIKNFDAENVKENGRQKVIVLITGDEKQTSEFIKYSKDNSPNYVESAKVSIDTDRGQLEVMSIDDYQKILSAEQQDNMVQGGLGIGEKVDILGSKIDSLRNETGQNFKMMDDNFKGLDIKYRLISEGMFAIVDEIKETNKAFENRMEKIESNIESLLNILVQQKK